MADQGRITITDRATPGLVAYKRDMQKGLTEEMIRQCNRLRNGARRKLRWRSKSGAGLGGRFTGNLSQKITYDVASSPNEISGAVGTGVEYAKYVEGWNSRNEKVPVQRHFVPFKTAPGLLQWALRHGVVEAVSRKAKRFIGNFPAAAKHGLIGGEGGLMVGGPDSITPFMEPTFNELIADVQAKFYARMVRVNNTRPGF